MPQRHSTKKWTLLWTPSQGEFNKIDENKVSCGSRTCKPNFVRRNAPAGRSFLWAAHCCAAQATYPEVVTRRAGTCPGRSRTPSLFGLAPCGVCPARPITAAAVRSYRTFSPLPGVAAGAVCFLWHFPSTGLEPGLPDVIRHTALRSSDFPPSLARERPSGPAANHLYYMRWFWRVPPDHPACILLGKPKH